MCLDGICIKELSPKVNLNHRFALYQLHLLKMWQCLSNINVPIIRWCNGDELHTKNNQVKNHLNILIMHAFHWREIRTWTVFHILCVPYWSMKLSGNYSLWSLKFSRLSLDQSPWEKINSLPYFVLESFVCKGYKPRYKQFERPGVNTDWGCRLNKSKVFIHQGLRSLGQTRIPNQKVSKSGDIRSRVKLRVNYVIPCGKKKTSTQKLHWNQVIIHVGPLRSWFTRLESNYQM